MYFCFVAVHMSVAMSSGLCSSLHQTQSRPRFAPVRPLKALVLPKDTSIGIRREMHRNKDLALVRSWT